MWGCYENPGPSQVWEGGHHLNRWPPVPGTCPERPNLTHRHMQNWAKQAALGQLVLLTDQTWPWMMTWDLDKYGQLWGGGYHLNRWPPVPGTCPESPKLTRSHMPNWVKTDSPRAISATKWPRMALNDVLRPLWIWQGVRRWLPSQRSWISHQAWPWIRNTIWCPETSISLSGCKEVAATSTRSSQYLEPAQRVQIWLTVTCQIE